VLVVEALSCRAAYREREQQQGGDE